MDWPSLPLDKIGTVAIVVLVGWFVFRGYLVPRAIVKDLTSSRDERIKELSTERDARQKANETLMEALQVRDRQFAELMELSRTTNALIKSLTGSRADT